MITVAAGILAGGKSSRMGQDKTLFAWKGRTFIGNVVNACRDFEEIIISADKSEKYSSLGFPVVEDTRSGYGPMEGLCKLLEAASSDYVFLLAADMPLMNKAFLDEVLKHLTADIDCLVVRCGGRVQPMCSVYSKRLLPALQRLIDNGEHKLRLIFDQGVTQYLDLDGTCCGTEAVININTWDEYIQTAGTYGRRMEDFAPFLKERLRKERVLVCYLDGLGAFMYRKAALTGSLFFTGKHFLTEPVISVRPPLTNAAMATMITGVSPDIHNIRSHKQRTLAIPTVFAGRSAEDTAFFEGDTRILVTEMMPTLHPKRGGCGSDHWVAEATVSAAKRGVPFIFSHFHEIDDAAHEFGPYSDECMRKIAETDEYLRRISDVYEGTFLIISDHGVCEGDDGGVHGVSPEGEYSAEEMTAVWGERQ